MKYGPCLFPETRETFKETRVKNFEIEELKLTPHMDLETFMIVTRNKRVDQASAEVIEEFFPKWKEMARSHGITIGANKYLLVWLEQDVEREINQLWETSPSRAFSANNLAQAILMTLIQDLMPEVAMQGCAPVPRPNPGLRAALEEIGVPWDGQASLGRQYAMLTPYPYQGSCTICFLKDECPKLAMEKSEDGDKG